MFLTDAEWRCASMIWRNTQPPRREAWIIARLSAQVAQVGTGFSGNLCPPESLASRASQPLRHRFYTLFLLKGFCKKNENRNIFLQKIEIGKQPVPCTTCAQNRSRPRLARASVGTGLAQVSRSTCAETHPAPLQPEVNSHMANLPPSGPSRQRAIRAVRPCSPQQALPKPPSLMPV